MSLTQANTINKVVLAYSGGLDTSAIIPWLKEHYQCEVVAFAADVGQGDEELTGLHEKALQSGASECHIVDLKHEFVEDYIFPTVQTGAVYEGEYLLGDALADGLVCMYTVCCVYLGEGDAVSPLRCFNCAA